jgi:hypothetical protein
VVSQCAVGLGALPFGDFEFVSETDGGESKEFIVSFDAAFDFGFQIVRSRDSARFQRTGKCAGQSTGERRNDMVDRGRKGSGVFHAVIFCVAAMHPKMKGFRESLDVRVPERPFLLDQTDFGGMNEFTHEFLLFKKMLHEQKRCKRGRRPLLIVLNQREDIEAAQFAAAVEESEFDGEGGAFD